MYLFVGSQHFTLSVSDGLYGSGSSVGIGVGEVPDRCSIVNLQDTSTLHPEECSEWLAGHECISGLLLTGICM